MKTINWRQQLSEAKAKLFPMFFFNLPWGQEWIVDVANNRAAFRIVYLAGVPVSDEDEIDWQPLEKNIEHIKADAKAEKARNRLHPISERQLREVGII